MKNIALGFEVRRKLVHLTSLWIPFIYYYDPKLCSYLLYITTFCMLSIDISRIFSPKIDQFILDFLKDIKLGNVFRSEEKKTLSGASYMLGGASVLINFVSPDAFFLAYMVLVISDSVAALYGLKWGHIKIFNSKTLEGALAFFTTSLMIIILFNSKIKVSSDNAIAACFFTTLAELIAKKIRIDDNLLIPVVFCLVFEICNKFNF